MEQGRPILKRVYFSGLNVSGMNESFLPSFLVDSPLMQFQPNCEANRIMPLLSGASDNASVILESLREPALHA